MKIYVVTKGEYSAYHIIAATLNKQVAEEIAKRYSDDYDDAIVNEFEDMEINYKKKIITVFFNKQGLVKALENSYNEDYHLNDIGEVHEWPGETIYITLFADTKEEAIKISAEKRAKYLAQKIGL